MTFPAWFAILVGTGMIGQWFLSYKSKQIPELQTEPIRIWFHIAGEMATALTLLISGVGLFAQSAWAPYLFLVSVGMLFYTAIVSPGYFAQRGQWIWVLIFGGIIALGLLSIITLIGSMAW